MKKQKSALSETLKQEFKKDLELFEYFLVLLNSSSPIRNVELMWADDLELFDPAQRSRVNTGDALVQLQVNGANAPGRSSPVPALISATWSMALVLTKSRPAPAVTSLPRSVAVPPPAVMFIPATWASPTLPCP